MFVGLAPWHWTEPGYPAPSSFPADSPMNPGLKFVPGMRKVYEEIGREIVNAGRVGKGGAA